MYWYVLLHTCMYEYIRQVQSLLLQTCTIQHTITLRLPFCAYESQQISWHFFPSQFSSSWQSHLQSDHPGVVPSFHRAELGGWSCTHSNQSGGEDLRCTTGRGRIGAQASAGNLSLLGLRTLMSRCTQPADCMELACTSYILSSARKNIQIHTSIYQQVLRMCQYVLVHTGNDTNIYIQSKSISPRFATSLNVSWTWRQGMDTNDQSHRTLTWQIMISISQSNSFHCILVMRLILRSSIIGYLIVELLQQGLIVLTCPGMKAMYMKTSLLFDKLATDLMFSIWACCNHH
jgi:hypothetical protein